MSLWVDVARVAIAVNLLLLATLLFVWGRNYRAFRSKHTLGLVLFASFLFLENGLAFYFYLLHPVLKVWVTDVSPTAQVAMTALRVAEMGGIAFITWVTWD
ncbi:MAG: hypothetical protein GWN73_15175 [Actinobacteria bacterium]|nr:hypothetical protein [Actinomycetota bacterium]